MAIMSLFVICVGEIDEGSEIKVTFSKICDEYGWLLKIDDFSVYDVPVDFANKGPGDFVS